MQDESMTSPLRGPSYDGKDGKTSIADLKSLVQILVCGLWLIWVFYWLSRPPVTPPNFPEQSGGALPLRATYNPELAAALDQGMRDFWQKPDQVLSALGDLEGLNVADIGCGEGYFTLPLLEAVGPQGRVFATDIQAEVLETLKKRIPKEHEARVQLILANEKETGVPEKVDIVLLVQVLGEVESRKAFLQQIRDIMADQGRLALIDSKHLTDPSNGFTRPLNLVLLLEELREAGFVLDENYDPLLYDFLPKQFFFILRVEP